jgi:hypothetical protein
MTISANSNPEVFRLLSSSLSKLGIIKPNNVTVTKMNMSGTILPAL